MVPSMILLYIVVSTIIFTLDDSAKIVQIMHWLL